MNRCVRFVLAGEGGQGVQVLGRVLAQAAVRAGKEALYMPAFGIEQRGGVSLAYVQVAAGEIGAPKFRLADYVAALSRRAVARVQEHLGPDTVFLVDASCVPSRPGTGKLLVLPALEKAQRLHPRLLNLVFLGALVAASGIVGRPELEDALEENLGARFHADPGLRLLSLRALEAGEALVAGGTGARVPRDG